MRQVETHLYEVQRQLAALGVDTSRFPERLPGESWKWGHVTQAETRLKGIQELRASQELLNR